MEAYVFQQAITLASLAAVCLVTSEVLANRTHAYRIHAKMAVFVHLYLMAHLHAHAHLASMAISVNRILASQIHA